MAVLPAVSQLALPLTRHFSIDTHPFAGAGPRAKTCACGQAAVGPLTLFSGKIAMLRNVAQGAKGRAGWLAGAAVYGIGLAALAQMPIDRPAALPASIPLAPPTGGAPLGPGQLVVDVLIRGDHTTKDYEIQKYIHTRKDREFDSDVLQGDVRRLVTSSIFKDVKTFVEQAEGGVVVVFEVFERPRIREIKFLGNRGFSDKKLTKEIGLKKGDPLNSYAAEESRRKIEQLYHSGGYPKAAVAIFEGDRPGDKDLIFLVNEGYLERVSKVSFEGNTISPDGVLKTRIQSKPGWFWYFFGGKVDRSKIDADVQALTAYYRALGYFRARISRTLEYDPSGKWLTLKFIIDEGPRYKVRNVSIEGGTKFATQPLRRFLELKEGEFFNQGESNKDLTTLIDLYGSQGHVFADVQADLRFLEEPGQLDVAYRIKEGDVFKVSEINVKIAGDFPHTKQTVVLNRVSLRPGDVIDTREVRNSERRLLASTIFAGSQKDGEPPRIVIRPPDLSSIGGMAAASPPPQTIRGQEPEAGPSPWGPSTWRSQPSLYSWYPGWSAQVQPPVPALVPAAYSR
jgi:outer membrane protein insertion porin family